MACAREIRPTRPEKSPDKGEGAEWGQCEARGKRGTESGEIEIKRTIQFSLTDKGWTNFDKIAFFCTLYLLCILLLAMRIIK